MSDQRTKDYHGFPGWVSSKVPLPKPGTLGWKINGLLTRMHARILRRTRGRIGGTFDGAPLLVLHSTGAKTGERRANPTIYLPDGDNFVIVASIGGTPKNPAWYHNLRTNPDDVEVDLRGERRAVRARQASPDEAEALWPRLFATYPPFRTYMTRTEREFPVMILEPRT